MIGLGHRMVRREDLVVDHREVIVAHQHGVGRVITLVTVGQVAVALLIDVAIARDQQVSARAESRAYAAIGAMSLKIESHERTHFPLYKSRVYSGWWQVANDFFTMSNLVGGASSLFTNVNRKAFSEET